MIVSEKTPGNFTVFLYKNAKGDKYYLSSRYNPQKEAFRLLKKKESQKSHLRKKGDPSCVFIMGIGNPYLISELLKVYKGIPVIGVYFDHLLKEIVKTFLQNESGISSDMLACFKTVSRKELDLFLPVFFKNLHGRYIEFAVNQSEMNLFPGIFSKIQKQIRTDYDKKSINKKTLSRFEHTWIKNIMLNTGHIIRSIPIKDIASCGKSLYALIIAAGPSLASFIDNIKANRNRFYIIAVDTVYKTLLKNNITPDMVIIVDPQKINSRYVENVASNQLAHTLFVCEPAVYPKALEGKTDRIVMFDTIFPWYNLIKSYFGSKGEIDMGGSVATTALEIAKTMNFTKIGFIGLDLCFKKDSYHVPGTIYEEFWFSTVSRFNTFEMKTFKLLDYFNLEKEFNMKGELVYVDARFVMFKNWFAKKLKDNVFPVCNLTREGIEIGGMDYCSFKMFAEEAKNVLNSDVYDMPLKKEAGIVVNSLIMKKSKAQTEPKESRLEQYENFCFKIQKIESAIEDYLICIEAALKKAEQVITAKKKQYDSLSYEKSLNKAEQKLSEHFEGKEMINIGLQGIINDINDDKDIDFGYDVSPEVIPYEKTRYLYKAMVKSCRLNLRYIQKYLQNRSSDYAF